MRDNPRNAAEWRRGLAPRPAYQPPFNPAIAGAFFRAGFIEAWGRGIEKICKVCREARVQPPLFHARTNSFMLEFCQPHAAQQVTQPQGKLAKTGRKQRNMLAIVELMRQNPTIKIADIAKEVGISVVYTSTLISKLKAAGKIERENGRKIGKWVILD